MGLHIKKTLRASEQEREDIKIARQEWEKWAKTCDINRLVFIDESAAQTNMVPVYGRAMKGERCCGFAKGSWQTTTMLSSVRLNGTTQCMVFAGAVNKTIFGLYMTKSLLPVLKDGDIVIMDNLSSHKNSFDKSAFAERNITIKYLPPYSPDLNPIEKMWSKIKTILRNKSATTTETLFEAIKYAFECITPKNTRGWFNMCGYSQ